MGALYEQMMIDEGYDARPGLPEERDTAYLKLRLGQFAGRALAQCALHRRHPHAHRCHDHRAANDFFEKEGYQTRSNAEREVKRGTGDPTYLMYTLGKLQIQKLRADWTGQQKHAPSPKEFHDLFMRQGVAPVKVIRRALFAQRFAHAMSRVSYGAVNLLPPRIQ